MSSITHFDSRTAKVNYSAEVVYNFATDLRNFRQFVPSDSFSELDFNQDSCSFRANTLGTVTVSLKEKIMFSKIVFSGNALLQNDFLITIFLQETPEKHSEIKLSFEAEMNPLFRMAASEPVKLFLETLVKEMEKFDGWSGPNEYNPPL
jgi:hypothetical protein